MSFDLFERDPAAVERSQAMNRMIVGRLNAKRSRGTLGRTGETSPTNEVARERLSQALSELESAKRSGDYDWIHWAEFLVERATAASEDARLHPRNEDGTFASFDGGVQGRGIKQPRAGWRESPNAIFKEFIAASRQQARERETEQTIHAHI
jgi:hypothetical protein